MTDRKLLALDRRHVLTSVSALLFGVGLVFLIQRYDAPLVLAAMLVLGALALVFISPDIAIAVVMFALYANLPAVAARYHNVPYIAAGSISLLLAAPLASYLIARGGRLRVDHVFALMLLFLLVVLASAFSAKDLGVAAKRIGTFVLEGLVLYWLTINAIRSHATLRRVIWVLLLAGSLLGALSLYQVATRGYDRQFGGLAQRNLEFENDESGGGDKGVRDTRMRVADRAGGPVGDPNRYAQIMLVLLPLAFFRWRGERSRWMRFGALIASGLILCGVLLSYSRGAFLTLAALVVLMTFMRYIRPYQILIAAFLFVFLVAAVAPAYYERIATIGGVRGFVSKRSGLEPDAVTRGRLTEMLAALKVFLDHPVLGVGPGQYAPFYSVSYQKDPDIALRQITVKRRAHDLYIEMAAETGLIGFTVFMSIVLLVLHRLLRARRRWRGGRPDLADLATAFALSILAYLGTAVFLHLSYERYYWFLLAMAGATLQILRLESLAASTTREGCEESRGIRFRVADTPARFAGGSSSGATA